MCPKGIATRETGNPNSISFEDLQEGITVPKQNRLFKQEK
jgi:hypothetical protein